MKNLILLTICWNIALVELSHHHYEYDHKSVYIPLAIKYPQQIVQYDNAWSFGPPHNPYRHREEHPNTYELQNSYQYQVQLELERIKNENENLVQCLNAALTKLNRLLPPLNSQTKESTQFPPSTNPEVLAYALNEAINRLEVFLTKMPLPLSTNHEINHSMMSPSPPVITPNQVSLSVNSAIKDLDKLFANLPDELKAPNENVNTNKNDISDIEPTDSPLEFHSATQINNNLPTESFIPLFTSKIVTEEQTTQNNVPSVTEKKSVIVNDLLPILSSASLQNNKDNTLFTSVLLSDDKNMNSTLNNNDTKTDLPVTNIQASTLPTVVLPQIDIRFGPNDEIVFPDQFEKMDSQNKKPISVDIETRFQETQPIKKPVSMETSTVISLEYVPLRPPIHPDPFPPKPDSNLQTDTNKISTASAEQVKKPAIVLEYKPSRPTFQADPLVYPQPIIRPSTENSNAQTVSTLAAIDFSDRNKATTTTTKPANILEYKPTRPSFAPDPVFYPENVPQATITDRPLDLSDRNKVTTSTTEKVSTSKPIRTTTTAPAVTHYYSTPISLEYKPSRPSFVPNPIVYPQPIIRPGTSWPASSTERLKAELEN